MTCGVIHGYRWAPGIEPPSPSTMHTSLSARRGALDLSGLCAHRMVQGTSAGTACRAGVARASAGRPAARCTGPRGFLGAPSPCAQL